MALTKGVVNELQKFFNSATKQVKLNSKLGKFLSDYQDLGKINQTSKLLSFDVSQKKNLRAELEQTYGQTLLTVNFNELTYLQSANVSKQEKLAGVKPNDNYVLVKVLSENALSINGHKQIPSNLAMRVSIDDIGVSAIKHLVVIENLTAFDHIDKAILPPQLMSAVFIYRGHEKYNAKGCLNLLNKLPQACQIIAFTDFDPKGLEIALTIAKVSACLLPELSRELIATSHEPDYEKQYSSMVYLNKVNNKHLREYIKSIESKRLSIKQEHILVTHSPLSLVKIEPNK
ncbi:hypothetical protein [Thalassomonas sp. M1454]|uniref:DUF7281 domain-containing protein n=1 Tax=Thalassomonas sp. M1454 TaxID=2594477 RepID=UPI00117FCD28|nr:hypothetical protein [Thalassomonas sp. M1454]TRX57047.1 hypothetical protein FNN08_05980 [Thalassomonas sp. M1454]